MKYELTDDEWAKLEALLPKKKKGRPCIDLRRTPPSASGTAFTVISVVCNNMAWAQKRALALINNTARLIKVAPQFLDGLALTDTIVMADNLARRLTKYHRKHRNVVERFFQRLNSEASNALWQESRPFLFLRSFYFHTSLLKIICPQSLGGADKTW